ncbi:MAG: hypothetical protein ACOC2W_04230 [bacterium]
MASTKNPKISRESIEKDKEYKSIDEMYRELDREIKTTRKDLSDNKNNIVDDLFKRGDNIVNEISKQKQERETKRMNFILLIIEKHGTKYGDFEFLDSFSVDELIKYYNEKRKENNVFLKILKFLNIIK